MSAPRAPFAPGDFVLLRSPLLPFETVEASGTGTEAGAPGRSREADDRWLLELCRRPEVNLALRVASPSLAEALDRLEDRDPPVPGDRLRRSLVRYVYRMASRATPFGLFAGVSVGRIADHTTLETAPRRAWTPHCRLDIRTVRRLVTWASSLPEAAARVTYRPNSSLYELCGQYRYCELDGDANAYRLSAVEASREVRLLIEACRERPATIEDLASLLAAEGAGEQEAMEFVRLLIDSQLLESCLSISATGPEPLDDLLGQLDALGIDGAWRSGVGELRAEVARLEVEWLEDSRRRYLSVARSLSAWAPLPGDGVFLQVDLSKPAPALSLGSRVVTDALRGADLLRRYGGNRAGGRELADFRDRFRARYGGNEIRLVEALDPDAGIGFGAASAGGHAGDEEREPGTRRSRALARLAERAIRTQDIEVVPTLDELAALEEPARPPVSGSVILHGCLAARSSEAVERGEYGVGVFSVVGPSAGRMLGRFCHAEPALGPMLSKLMRQEDAFLPPGAVSAEVVHVGTRRTGNLVLRPVLRTHEIPYLSRPHDGAVGIAIDDLRVGIVGDRVRLRSARLGREVVPRLATAYRADLSALPIYRFLAALEGQENANALSFRWGSLDSLSFLPRVRVGRLVLHRARWRLDTQDLAGLREGGPASRVIADLRRSLRWPRWLMLEELDNHLLVDFDNPLSVENLCHMLRRRSVAVLREMWPPPDQLCLTGGDGRYVHEFMLPAVVTGQREDQRPARSGPPEARSVRLPALPPLVPQAPLGDWLYLKLYASPGSMDRLLAEVVGSIAGSLESSSVTRWFFVRYADPDPHVRLRFRLADAASFLPVAGEVESRIDALPNRLGVWRIQIERYQPELDRYGGPCGLEICEQLFQIDSEAVCQALRYRRADGDRADGRLGIRSLRLLCAIECLLRSLQLDLAARHALLGAWSRRRVHHRDGDGATARLHQANRLYRANRASVDALLAGRPLPDGLRPYLAWLPRFRSRSRAAAGRLIELERAGRLGRPVAEIAASLVHMSANRWLHTGDSDAELLLYGVASKAYGSLLARGVHEADGALAGAQPSSR